MQTRSRSVKGDAPVPATTMMTAAAAARDARLSRACFEALEDRRMLAATATLLTNGVLRVSGTDGDDTLTVSGKGTQLVVQLNGKTKSFTASGVRGLKIDGGAGNDALKIATGVRAGILRGGDGNDTLVGGDGADRLDGGAGKDAMRGRSGFDMVTYKGRTNALVITLDDVSNDGEAGERDNVRGDVEAVVGGSGNDRITGGGAANALYGGAGNDTLLGEGNSDTLRGEGGNDTLVGGAAADYFFGGSGKDSVSYEGVSENLTLTLDGSANDGRAGENDDLKNDVENVIGGSGNDRIVGTARNERLYGGAGNDTLVGGAGDDSLAGGDGDDFITGDAGGDTMKGDAGQDTVSYSARTAALKVVVDALANDGEVGPGGVSVEKDLVRTSVEIIIGGWGNDHLVGGSADNLLRGGRGNDTLDGLGGNDTLEGEHGNDSLLAGAGNDGYFGGDGTGDVLTYQHQSAGVRIRLDGIANDGPDGESDNVGSDIELFYGSQGDDSIVGSDAGETIHGQGGNDTIRGGAGDDNLVGGKGDDIIEGGAGKDRMQGLEGNDTIYAIDNGRDDRINGDSGDNDTAYVDELEDAGAVIPNTIEHLFFEE